MLYSPDIIIFVRLEAGSHFERSRYSEMAGGEIKGRILASDCNRGSSAGCGRRPMLRCGADGHGTPDARRMFEILLAGHRLEVISAVRTG
jgi:hypothetical protein